ncbi:alpha-ribazole phosphatase [Carboxylicivirga sp. N1Y90]|uniref:alpha-ribazole phosphatase n=1 Tax=Carboxylicivirga fragile TaxID=3417571 RepID=UPI003D352AC9|nr:alpha-ribazole phosphatase [Marinilabiliaceae bacterium N1Y90]
MIELLLIRHTTPDVKEGTCYGQIDLNCHSCFDSEADDINQILTASKYSPDIIFSSPLKRCKLLATHLFHAQKVYLDENLKELNFGDWEGMFWKAIPKNEIDVWAENFVLQSPPNGESFKQLLKRVEQFEKQMVNGNSKKIAIVTHSGIIRAFLMKYLNIPASNIFNLHLNYGAIVKISIHDDDYHQVEIIKG